MVLVLAALAGPATPAFADEVAAEVSKARSESLPVIAAADRVAGASAAAQAAAGDIFHTELSGLLGTCDAVGEVVGAGPNISSVFSAFQQSADHRNIITHPTWTAIGTGQATGSNGVLYVSVVFCQLAGDPGPPEPPPGDAGPAALVVVENPLGRIVQVVELPGAGRSEEEDQEDQGRGRTDGDEVG